MSERGHRSNAARLERRGVTLSGMGMYEFDEHVCHGRDGFARNDFVAMGAQRERGRVRFEPKHGQIRGQRTPRVGCALSVRQAYGVGFNLSC